MTAKNASLSDVASWGSNLSNDFLLCRTGNHRWNDWGNVTEESKGMFLEVVECERCESTRSRRYTIENRRVKLLPAKYEYSDGYQVPADMGRVTSTAGRGVLLYEKHKRRKRPVRLHAAQEPQETERQEVG